MFKRATIIGLGMIGASMARSFKDRSIAKEVVGVGRTMENLTFALESGFVDSVTRSAVEGVAGSDLIVLSTPVETFEQIARDISSAIEKGTLVIDAGSIKGTLVNILQEIMPEGVEFVGCHPIAGSENSGAASSVRGLFEGALCLITPTDKNSDDAVSRAADIWEAMGSQVRMMDPMEHDELLGAVSHFPHLAAFAMVNAIEDMVEGACSLSGAGLKDTTRIAMSPGALWRDIAMMNRDNVIPVLDAYIKELETIKGALQNRDAGELVKRLELAESRRRKVEG